MAAPTSTMEILVIVAVIAGPLLAALIDYVRDLRSAPSMVSTDTAWRELVETLRGEHLRKSSEVQECHEKLHVANGTIDRLNAIIERLLSPLPGGVSIINAGAGASVGQAAAGTDISQMKKDVRERDER